jgi:hypothetical protein
MRFLLFLGHLFLQASLLRAQYDQPVQPVDLPAWMAEQLIGEAPKTALKSTTKPVHSNAFVGTWIIRATGSKRLLYWGDEHRMIIQEVQGMDTPVRTTLVDLHANISAVFYPSQGVYVGKVRDLYHPQQGYFLELWSDSVVATGKRDTLMNEPVAEYVGTNSNGGSISYWRTTAHPKLFDDLRVWGPWLREGEVKYLSALNNERTGPAIRVSWDGKQYTPTKGELTLHKVTPGCTGRGTSSLGERHATRTTAAVDSRSLESTSSRQPAPGLHAARREPWHLRQQVRGHAHGALGITLDGRGRHQGPVRHLHVLGR